MRAFLLSVFVFWGLAGIAQPLGLRSARTNLNYIESDTVRIIYEVGQEEQARRVADVVHHMAKNFPISGSRPVEKISIILQNKTDIPNGYVGLAPWRSEFYTSPPPDNFNLGSLPWVDLLAIHEYRHVQQRSASKRGLTGAAYYIFGEAFFSAIGNISWPNWYLEGDAVIAETVLSNQGRGRLPAFLNGYREKVTNGKTWDYMKARNGSLRDYVPNHYNLGFLMQNYGRYKYGQDFWDKVALESASYKGLIYPFSNAVKRVSGKSTKEFYAEAMEYYGEIWKTGDTSSQSLGEEILTPRAERFELQSYPVVDAKGRLFIFRESFDHIGQICEVFDGIAQHITYPGYTAEPYFTVGGDKIAWAEYRLNSRWEREDYSSIVVYDMNTNRKKKITSRTSYFTPALSSDGNKIAAVYDNDSHSWRLHVLNSESGDLVKVLPNTKNYYISYPVWSSDDTRIYSALRDSAGQMAIAVQELQSGNIEVLTNWTFDPIGRPTLTEDHIYFTMSTGWVDRVCRVPIQGGEVEQLHTSSVTSMYNPVVNESGDLLYTVFTLQGDKLNSIPSEEIAWAQRVEQDKSYLAVDESEGDLLGSVPTRNYKEENYGLFRQPVYIHSWRPIFDDPIYQFEFQSLNVLQSFRWHTGFQWNSNTNDIGPYTEFVLGMWYPEISFRYSGWTRDFVREEDNQRFKWFEHTVSAGISIPFRGFHGPYNYFGSIETRINRQMAVGADIENANLNFLSHKLNFVHRQRQAQKHPITRFGQAIEIILPYSIDADTAWQFQLKTDFTFPSPIRNHVLWLQADYRKEPDDRTYRFGDDFNYSRGYEPFRTGEVIRVGVNYQLPLVYPDWGVWGIAYVKRIRTNLFYDFSRAWSLGAQADFPSVGAELIFDMDFLNVQSFTWGVRWSYLLKEDPLNPGQRNVFSIFIPTNRI